MSLAIKVPVVGESITEVTIATWLKQDGDYVEMDELICELESDKATFELAAEAAGILKVKAQEGETLEIGVTICEIDTDAKGAPPSSSDKTEEIKTEDATPLQPTSTATGEILEMRVPEVGESITEVTVSSWLKQEGDFVELDEIIAEIDSDKATFELPAEGQGFLKPAAQDGDTLQIGDLICKIEIMEGGASTKPATAATPAADQATSYATGHASPAAAKILDEKGIEASSITGTGVDGRITKEDALKAEKVAKSTNKPAESSTEVPAPSGERAETRKKMSSLRKTVSRRLVAVKRPCLPPLMR